jgi:predicted transcriptional regulator
MDAQQIIDRLKEFGLSEYEIAKRIPTVSQSTINRIATGKTANPGYDTWKALSELLGSLTAEGSKPPLSRASA